MVRVVVDAEMRLKLFGLREPVELVDENGEFLGVVQRNARRYPDRNWEPPIGPHERPPFGGQRTYSTEEVRQALKSS